MGISWFVCSKWYIIVSKCKCISRIDGIYKDITKDIEARFDTSNYELDRLLPKWENEKVIGFMKDKLGKKLWQNSLD